LNLLLVNQIDITFISETHLKEGKSFKNLIIQLIGAWLDKSWVAILVKKGIRHKELNISNFWSEEAIGIRIKLQKNGDVSVISAYKSSSRVIL
jgi:hypothetical protein